METGRRISCGDCNHNLRADAGPGAACPRCGSNKQKVSLDLADQLTAGMRDSIRGKVKDDSLPSKKKIRKEFFHGSDPRVSEGDFVNKDRIIDRDKDLYVERVAEENGTVLRDVRQKLSEHQGHGSAKFKTEKDGRGS